MSSQLRDISTQPSATKQRTSRTICKLFELFGGSTRVFILNTMRILLASLFVALATPAVAADTPKTPTKFVTQVLEPTGGKILRPKDWHYTESHRGPSYTWILSREVATNAPYTTGVRVQTLVGVKQGTGKSGEDFVKDFLATKKKEAAKVIKTCSEKNQGLFTRVCLETEEGPHHILYSLFWGANDLDMVVISIAGTTKELWPTYAPTFDKMSEFELIDMKRFEQ